jgi:hypothetical protein
MMTRITSVASQLFFGALFLVAPLRSQTFDLPITKDQPILKINLHDFGYANSRENFRLSRFVDFTDANHIAVAWLTYDDPASRRNKPAFMASPAHLHVLTLDIASGKEEGLKEWPTPSRPVRFHAQNGGRLMTFTGNTWQLYSATLELIRTRQLPDPDDCSSLLQRSPNISDSPGISFDGKFLLSSSNEQGKTHPSALLESETLGYVDRYNGDHAIVDLSDHWLVANDIQRTRLLIKKFNEPWRQLHSDYLDELVSNSGLKFKYVHLTPFFVSDEILLVESQRGDITVLNVDGNVLFHTHPPGKRWLEKPVRSSGGERFAIMEAKMRGLTVEQLDTSAFPADDRVVVFDIAERKAIFAVKLEGDSPWPPFQTQKNDIALSPDGHLLAIFADDVLEIYQLPQSK